MATIAKIATILFFMMEISNNSETFFDSFEAPAQSRYLTTQITRKRFLNTDETVFYTVGPPVERGAAVSGRGSLERGEEPGRRSEFGFDRNRDLRRLG